jgi:hypothetical protein
MYYDAENMKKALTEYSEKIKIFRKSLEDNENASNLIYEDYEVNKDLGRYLGRLRKLKNNVFDILRKAKNASEDVEMYGIDASKIKCAFFEKYNSLLSGIEEEIRYLETENIPYIKERLLNVLCHSNKCEADIGELNDETDFNKDSIIDALCGLEEEGSITSYIEGGENPRKVYKLKEILKFAYSLLDNKVISCFPEDA